jgi:hypothetical protein
MENRLLLTHDKKTMPRFVSERVRDGLSTPGVPIIHKMTVAKAIEEILIAAVCGNDGDFRDQARFLPL